MFALCDSHPFLSYKTSSHTHITITTRFPFCSWRSCRSPHKLLGVFERLITSQRPFDLFFFFFDSSTFELLNYLNYFRLNYSIIWITFELLGVFERLITSQRTFYLFFFWFNYFWITPLSKLLLNYSVFVNAKWLVKDPCIFNSLSNYFWITLCFWTPNKNQRKRRRTSTE